jgi:hypothetical protein
VFFNFLSKYGGDEEKYNEEERGKGCEQTHRRLIPAPASSLFRELVRAAWAEVVAFVRGALHATDQPHDNQSHVVTLRLGVRECE